MRTITFPVTTEPMILFSEAEPETKFQFNLTKLKQKHPTVNASYVFTSTTGQSTTIKAEEETGGLATVTLNRTNVTYVGAVKVEIKLFRGNSLLQTIGPFTVYLEDEVGHFNVGVKDSASAYLAMNGSGSAANQEELQELTSRVEALENTGIGLDSEGNAVSISADQVVTSGTEIGGITVGDSRTAFYIPDSVGSGAWPLLATITLSENVSTITITKDSNGKNLALKEGFYIDGIFMGTSSNASKYFKVSIAENEDGAVVPISSSQAIYGTEDTYFTVYAKQVGTSRWICEVLSGSEKYKSPTGVGNSTNQFGYSAFAGFSNPASTVGKIVIGYNTSEYGRSSKLYVYGR